VAEHAEQLAEAVKPFLQHRGDEYVLSRDEMPVPPVVMTTCTSGLASCRSIVPRTRSGSSVTTVRPTTACPAAAINSAMARPLVSVRSVRVSLMVMT
jgi:hypothetical protein